MHKVKIERGEGAETPTDRQARQSPVQLASDLDYEMLVFNGDLKALAWGCDFLAMSHDGHGRRLDDVHSAARAAVAALPLLSFRSDHLAEQAERLANSLEA